MVVDGGTRESITRGSTVLNERLHTESTTRHTFHNTLRTYILPFFLLTRQKLFPDTGLTVVFLFLATGSEFSYLMQELAGFGFGASSIALFARVAGGIYTKAADVGADLVGKVEAGIDEDDPHNPAVIADNVGDNVGDVAGMGADLFESYVGSIIAAATLASLNPDDPYVNRKVALPFYLAGAGIFGSITGYFFVKTDAAGDGWNTNLGELMWALEKGMFVAGAILVGLSFFICMFMFNFTQGLALWLCVSIGKLFPVHSLA